jgi:hypothetical protein
MSYKIKTSMLSAALAISLLSLVSCRKVIDLDLNTTEKQYVIEGSVAKRFLYRVPQGTTNPELLKDSVWVKVSQTKDFNNSNAFSGTSGAEVTISDNGGTPVTLIESATKGVYLTNGIDAEIGHNYTLTVKVGGKTFTSSSVMPDSVVFRKVYQENLDVFRKIKIVANVEFTDPVGKGNAYRFVQYRNGVQTAPIFVQNDDLTDGRNVVTQLNSYSNTDDDEEEFKKGDNMLVEMQCITKPVYKFWFSLNVGATGSGQNATPANPESNISGGAMGYFSAHTSQFKSLPIR